MFWSNSDGVTPDWCSADRLLVCHLHPSGFNDELCLLFNAEDRDVMFILPLPQRSSTRWWREIDTADTEMKKQAVLQPNYCLLSHSLVVLSVPG